MLLLLLRRLILKFNSASCRKLLNNGVGGDSAAKAQLSPAVAASADKKKMPKFSKSDHEALVEIFKKIGQKEQTKQVMKSFVILSFGQQSHHLSVRDWRGRGLHYVHLSQQ